MASNQKLKVIQGAQVIPELNKENPFRPNNPIKISSPGAATLFGADNPGRNTDQYIRFDVPASWNQALVASGTAGAGIVINANLADGLIDANAGTILAAELLTVIVLVNNQPIGRVSFDSAPGAGQFNIEDDGGVTTIVFGTAYGKGTKVEVLLIGSAETSLTNVTDVSGGALTAGIGKQVRSNDYMNAGVADVVLEALGCV